MPMQLMMLLGVDLFMLFQILRTLELLAADDARVRLEIRVNAEMRRDVIALSARDAAAFPVTGQAQVVGRLAADMGGRQVVVELVGARGDAGRSRGGGESVGSVSCRRATSTEIAPECDSLKAILPPTRLPFLLVILASRRTDRIRVPRRHVTATATSRRHVASKARATRRSWPRARRTRRSIGIPPPRFLVIILVITERRVQ